MTDHQETISHFKDLPADFQGEFLRFGEEGYAKSRFIFNMRSEEARPALIARAAGADDVAVLMRWASQRAIPVAIRGGGHSVDGSAMPDGALVLDLTALRRIDVDAATGRVRAEAGVLLGELDAATQAHGLVVPAGTVSTTGVAGLTLGGGIGHLMRRFGATVDSLLSCDVVTVDGREVRANAAENPDLFWALRGGSGNFGVVTAFEFQGHALESEVAGGFILFTLDQARDVMAKLRVHMVSAPRELGMSAALVPCPAFPPVPAELHGAPVLMLVIVYTGPLDRLDAIIGPLAALGRPSGNLVAPAPWVQVNRMLDAVAPYGRRAHTRGGYLSELGDEAIAIMIEAACNAPAPTGNGPSTAQTVWFMGGAISEDFDEDHVAFSREGAKVLCEIVGQWDGAAHDAAYVAWVDGLADALSPHMRRNGYSNLTTDRGPAWLRGLYGSESKYQRLIAAKTRWDPGNLLRFNKNLEPARRREDA
jgi:hypothetical protein